jgi:hypothetical protein
MHSALLLSTLLTFSLSSVAQQQKCETGYPFFVNASDSTTRVNQFQPPFGPLRNESVKWSWTLATACYNIEGSQGAVEQRLWLDTQPTLDLLSDDLGVIGCGVVAHGLTHDALEKGQNDNGTCSSMLSQTCIQSILNATSEAAHGTTTAGSSASEICANFENLQQNQMSGLPSECSASFVKGAWLQSFGRVLIIYISVRPGTTNTKQRHSLCIPSSRSIRKVMSDKFRCRQCHVPTCRLGKRAILGQQYGIVQQSNDFRDTIDHDHASESDI